MCCPLAYRFNATIATLLCLTFAILLCFNERTVPHSVLALHTKLIFRDLLVINLVTQLVVTQLVVTIIIYLVSELYTAH